MATTIITKAHDTKITFKDTPTINNVPLLPADLVGCSLSFLLKIADGTIALKKPATINPDATFQYQPVAGDVASMILVPRICILPAGCRRRFGANRASAHGVAP